MPEPTTPPPVALDALPLFRPVPSYLQPPARAPLPPPARTPAPPTGRTSPAARPAPTPHTAQVDWRLVRSMRSEAAEQLATSLTERPDLDEQAQQERAKSMILDLLRSHDTDAGINGRRTFSPGELQQLQQAIFDSLYGLGRLEPLVNDSDVENISAAGFDNVWLTKSNGALVRGPNIAESDEEMIADIQFLTSRSGTSSREFSRAKPIIDTRLTGGQRLAARAWITPRPHLSIRIHRLRDIDLDDLVANGTLEPIVASLLRAAVQAGKSIVITGDRGSGKTVMVQALAAELHPSDFISVVESEAELMLEDLPRRHWLVFAQEARKGNSESNADGSQNWETSPSDLIQSAQRLPANRLIVGEVRSGPEVIAMLEAMQAGNGTLSTTHATSASAGVSRLTTLATGGGRVTSTYAQNQVAEHVDLIVHISLTSHLVDDSANDGADDGTGARRRHTRRVNDIIALEPGDQGGSSRGHSETRVFFPGPNGEAVAGALPEGLRQDLVAAGFDEDAYNRMPR